MRITSSTAERSPFPSRGRTKARSKLGRGLQLRAFEAIAVLINSAVIVLSKAAREALTRCSTAGGCSPALKPAGRSPSPPGMRVPDTLWGGLEGFTPPHNYRRGQRLPTDKRLPPAPRVSAGLRFAVRPLSGAIDREATKSGACVGTSSTANAVPLPLVGEGLNTVEVEA